MKETLKNFYDKLKDAIYEQIAKKLVESILGVNCIIALIAYIQKWQFLSTFSKSVCLAFTYITILLIILLIIKLIDCKRTKKYILEEYIALKNGKNWDLMFDEKTVIEELLKRDLQIFEGNMINSGLIQETFDDIQMNFDPDPPVMLLLERTYSRLQQVNWQATIINNLINHKFISQMPSRVNIYKINNSIWKFEQAKKRKIEKEELKKNKEHYKLLKQKRKPKLIYTKYEGDHKVFGFLGIRIKIKVHDEFKEFEL